MKPEPSATSSRQTWIDFIADPAHAHRLLYSKGESEYKAESGLLTENTLKDFLSRLSDVVKDKRLLCLLHYLLEPDVRDFLRKELAPLLRSMTKASTAQVCLSRGGARGRVEWSKTLRSRALQRANSAEFVIRQAHSSMDLPENQLVKLFLLRIRDAIQAAEAGVGTGHMAESLRKLKGAVELGLRSTYMHQVSTVQESNLKMKKRSYRHRNRRYSVIADLLETFEELFSLDRWGAIANLLRVGWFAPISDDDLFEIYCLSLVIDIIETEARFGKPYEFGLIKSHRRETARFSRQKDNVRVDVYFNRSPSEVILVDSMYKEILNRHEGITGASHRPDILLRVKKRGEAEKMILIEVKNTTNPGYQRQGIYKVLAYLQDFRQLSGARAVLIFPTGVRLRSNVKADELNVGIASGDDRSGLWQLLAADGLESSMSSP